MAMFSVAIAVRSQIANCKSQIGDWRSEAQSQLAACPNGQKRREKGENTVYTVDCVVYCSLLCRSDSSGVYADEKSQQSTASAAAVRAIAFSSRSVSQNGSQNHIPGPRVCILDLLYLLEL